MGIKILHRYIITYIIRIRNYDNHMMTHTGTVQFLARMKICRVLYFTASSDCSFEGSVNLFIAIVHVFA